MAEAKVTLTEPVVTSVILTLNPDEAELLVSFLGKTQLAMVEDIMPYEPVKRQVAINDTLYGVYEALHKFVNED